MEGCRFCIFFLVARAHVIERLFCEIKSVGVVEVEDRGRRTFRDATATKHQFRVSVAVDTADELFISSRHGLFTVALALTTDNHTIVPPTLCDRTVMLWYRPW